MYDDVRQHALELRTMTEAHVLWRPTAPARAGYKHSDPALRAGEFNAWVVDFAPSFNAYVDWKAEDRYVRAVRGGL